MATEIKTALRMTLVTLALTGLAYPLLMTGAAQALFPAQAAGSLVSRDGRVVQIFHQEKDRIVLDRNIPAIFDQVFAALAWMERSTGIPVSA